MKVHVEVEVSAGEVSKKWTADVEENATRHAGARSVLEAAFECIRVQQVVEREKA